MVVFTVAKLDHLLLIVGLLFTFLRLTEDLILDTSPQRLAEALPTLGPTLIVVGAGLMLLRRRMVDRAYRAVDLEAKAYLWQWEQLWSNPYEQRTLKKIQDLPFNEQEPGETLRQRYRVVDTENRGSRGRRSSNKSHRNLMSPIFDDIIGSNLGTPIQSLDQIYVQAAGLYPHVKHKVKQWAVTSRAYFPLNTIGGGWGVEEMFVKSYEAAIDPQVWHKIKWATLKRRERAIEKVVRSYAGDVSKLLDVCRQSIIFDNCSDLYNCLKAIVNDPEAVIMRAKNRLNPDYDAEKRSAGYRDVCLNMRLVNSHTTNLGVDGHVFELQLLLMAFAKMKNEDGHKHYVEFRNAQGQ